MELGIPWSDVTMIPAKKEPMAAAIKRARASPQESTYTPFSCGGSKVAEEKTASQLVCPYITELNEELEGNFDLINGQMPPLPCEIDELTVLLPDLSSHTKKTLVLDLDETLIHTYDTDALQGFPISKRRPLEKAAFVAEGGERVEVSYWSRPHVEEFLTSLSAVFEIIVSAPYALVIDLHGRTIGVRQQHREQIGPT